MARADAARSRTRRDLFAAHGLAGGGSLRADAARLGPFRHHGGGASRVRPIFTERVARMSQRVGAKRRPMTSSATCGEVWARPAPDIATLIRATAVQCQRA